MKIVGELKCEKCGARHKLEIHHLKYGAKSTYQDLELLCVDCHYAKHNRVNRQVHLVLREL